MNMKAAHTFKAVQIWNANYSQSVDTLDKTICAVDGLDEIVDVPEYFGLKKGTLYVCSYGWWNRKMNVKYDNSVYDGYTDEEVWLWTPETGFIEYAYTPAWRND